MDLSHVLLAYAQSYTVTRKDAGGYDSNGIALPPSTSTFPVLGVVQPISGKMLQRLPEGMRSEALVEFWTTTALRTQESGNQPDSVSIDGAAYQVQACEDWMALGGYMKSALLRVG